MKSVYLGAKNGPVGWNGLESGTSVPPSQSWPSGASIQLDPILDAQIGVLYIVVLDAQQDSFFECPAPSSAVVTGAIEIKFRSRLYGQPAGHFHKNQ